MFQMYQARRYIFARLRASNSLMPIQRSMSETCPFNRTRSLYGYTEREEEAVDGEELQQLQPAPPLLLRQTNPVQFAFKFLRSPDTKRQYPRNLKLFFD
jgi:hypothetical protein